MELEKMYGDLGISKEVLEYGARIEAALEDRFTEIDGNAEYNQLKVIAAMQKNLSLIHIYRAHPQGGTGYFPDDGYHRWISGRDGGRFRGDTGGCAESPLRQCIYLYLFEAHRNSGGSDGKSGSRRSCQRTFRPSARRGTGDFRTCLLYTSS